MTAQNATLGEVLQVIATSPSGKLNAVMAVGARVLSTTLGFLDTPVAILMSSVLGTYGSEKPGGSAGLYTGTSIATGAAATVVTLAEATDKWNHTVYGVVIDIVAGQNQTVGAVPITVAGSNLYNDAISNTILLDTPIPDAVSGVKAVRLFVLGAMALNGVSHYIPMNLRKQLVATEIPAQNLVVTVGSSPNFLPSGAIVSASALTRGNPHVDDLVAKLASIN